MDLTPKVLAAACADWRSQGWPDPTVWARIRVLRSALGWAYAERILDLHPLDGMRSPPHAAVRMHAPVDHVRAILACARQQAIDAAHPGRAETVRPGGPASGRADAAAHPAGRRFRRPPRGARGPATHRPGR